MAPAEGISIYTTEELGRHKKIGDAYLGTASIAQETQGLEVAAMPYALAAESYEEALRREAELDPATLAKDAICLEALAEAVPNSDEAGLLLQSARAEVNRAWAEAGGANASEVAAAPILVAEAKIAVAEGNPDKAAEILGSLNGHTPPAVEKLKEELRTSGKLPVNHVAEALLELHRAA
jgi:hypothetical protein